MDVSQDPKCTSEMPEAAARLRAATLLRRNSNIGIFLVNIAKFLRTAFSIEQLRWLLLECLDKICLDPKNLVRKLENHGNEDNIALGEL